MSGTGRRPGDEEDYMDWLERMWDVQKFDLPGRTDREDARTEDILKLFKGLGELAKRHVEPPPAPYWESVPERSIASDARPEQKDRSELEAAGWKRLKRIDGEDVWLDPENGFMYQQATALAIVREVTGNEADAQGFLADALDRAEEWWVLHNIPGALLSRQPYVRLDRGEAM